MNNMRYVKSILGVCLGVVFAATPVFAFAQNEEPHNVDEFYRARVVDVSEQTIREENTVSARKNIHVRIESGSEKGNEINILGDQEIDTINGKKISVGGTIVVSRTTIGDEVRWQVIDHYRIPQLGWVFVLFFVLVFSFTRKRGVLSLVGLGVSIAIIWWGVIPLILAGNNALAVSLGGAIAIAVISLYLAHGLRMRTTVSVVSTVVTLCVSVGVGSLFIWMSRLTGVGSEDAFFLQLSQSGDALDLQGILLGGILIGALGVLDDITTSQTAAVEEIYKANPKFSKKELYKRGLSVGREHITSLVNTLALAYIGASFPLFLSLPANISQPSWLLFNSEFIGEEVVRTLVGSTALVLAVPLTTLLAVYVFCRTKKI